MPRIKSFTEWHAEYCALAKKHNLEWLILSEEDMPRDAYENELLPYEALCEEISYGM